MQSLKSFWPLRATLPLTLTPDVVLLGRFALMFGFLSVAVLWLLAPGSSPQRTVPVAVNPGAVQARVNPAPPRALPQEITEPDQEATSEVPAATAAPASSEASVESDPAPRPAAPAPVVAAAPPPVIAQQLPAPPALPVPVPAEVEPQLVSVAASGGTKLAVIRLGSQVQTVTSGERIGSWIVRQIRADQVVLQQGNRTRILAFGRSGADSPTPATPNPSNNYSSPPPTAPAVQPTPPPLEPGRPPQPQAAPAPPDAPEATQDSEENPDQQPGQPETR